MNEEDKNNKENTELCDICYEPIKNKVLLECTHEVCLKCIVKILKIKSLSCPMCYDICIKDKDDQQEQTFELPHEYDIDIVPQNDHNLRALIIQENIDDQCKFYEVYINNDELLFSFIIIHEVVVPDSIIGQLIFKLVINAIPHDQPLQYLRQDVVQVGQYQMKNTNHYLQDYYDIIIERIEII